MLNQVQHDKERRIFVVEGKMLGIKKDRGWSPTKEYLSQD